MAGGHRRQEQGLAFSQGSVGSGKGVTLAESCQNTAGAPCLCHDSFVLTQLLRALDNECQCPLME